MKKIHKKRKMELIFTCIVLVFFVLINTSFGQSAEELQNQINAKNTEIQNLEKEIEKYNQEIGKTGKEAESLKTELKKLELTKKSLQADLKITETKISGTSLEIKQISQEIGDKEDTIDIHELALQEGFKKINEYDNMTLLERILKRETLSEGWNEVANIVSFQDSVTKHIEELKNVKKNLEEDKNEIEDVKDKLVDLKLELGDKKKIIDQNSTETNKLLKDTKNKESSYKKMLADKEKLKSALNKEVDDIESKLKFILDPSSLPKSGVLSWPLDKILITQRFGKTVAGKKLYASGSHNGVDFGVPTGTPVKSMADGVVIGQGDTDVTCKGASFGRWILIKYDNGLSSTYGHLSLIKVVAGQNVKRGEIVGYSGNTGYSTGPHLHVSMYASGGVEVLSKPSKTCGGRIYTMPFAAMNVYLDPLVYLPTDGTFIDRGMRTD